MPNYCDYTLKVKGNKDNCNKFLNKLESYDEPKHFWRIFESNIDEEGDDYLIISGNCAWSIEACCRAGGYSNGFDLFAENTKDLDLDLEVWSRENEGCFFEEHYIYNKGNCIIEDCVSIEGDYVPDWVKDEFPTFEEYVDYFYADSDCIPDENDFDEYGEYIKESDSSFTDWGEWHI